MIMFCRPIGRLLTAFESLLTACISILPRLLDGAARVNYVTTMAFTMTTQSKVEEIDASDATMAASAAAASAASRPISPVVLNNAKSPTGSLQPPPTMGTDSMTQPPAAVRSSPCFRPLCKYSSSVRVQPVNDNRSRSAANRPVHRWALADSKRRRYFFTRLQEKSVNGKRMKSALYTFI